MVILNGMVLGIHRRPLAFVNAFRKMRRAGRIGEFVSIHLQQDSVYIASDGGRVCRPLIICEGGVPKVTNEHLAKVLLHRHAPFKAVVASQLLYSEGTIGALC